MRKVELVAALLRVALAAAAQAAGSRAAVVRVVTAGSWGPRRRAALRTALQRAGAGDAELVAAPVAVGWHLLAGGAELAEQAFVVCDLGAGHTATVLARTGGGFDVLASVDAADGGGDALDAAVAEFLAPSGGAAELPVPSRLAKEALSVTQTVLVPGPSGEQIVFGLPQLRQAAAGVVDAAVAAAVQAVEAADVRSPRRRVPEVWE
ncbi:hypothetical protein [Dactylosporangium sp. NPDC006015]|uniref:hypothetical protein n=1 Tax=Dactylosporangium sp. NPDC006015 TaxID=3154576 RepID=UPI0033B796E5